MCNILVLHINACIYLLYRPKVVLRIAPNFELIFENLSEGFTTFETGFEQPRTQLIYNLFKFVFV